MNYFYTLKKAIVSYADSILFRGCYRGQASCHGPLDGIARKLKTTVQKLASQHKKLRKHPLCGFLKSKGAFAYGEDKNGDAYNFGTHYDLPCVPAGSSTPLEGFSNL